MNLAGSFSITDIAGNELLNNEPPTDEVFVVDNTAPTVIVNIVAAAFSDGSNSSEVTFEFSEAVTGFDASDVSVSGGTLSGFSGSGASYSATFTADDDLDATGSVSVAAGSYTDAAGNSGGAGSDDVVIDTSNPGPQTTELPDGGGSYEIFVDGSDLVMRVTGGAELFRRSQSSTTTLTITGSSGDDVVAIQDLGTAVDVPVVFNGGDGDDVFNGALGAGAMTLNGEAGDDSLFGGAVADVMNGGDGNDSLRANGGNDSVFGGSGNDRLYGGAQSDLLQGGDGDDLVDGQGSTDDSVGGGLGNDTINGGTGNDVLFDGGDVPEIVVLNESMSGLGNDVLIGVERALIT